MLAHASVLVSAFVAPHAAAQSTKLSEPLPLSIVGNVYSFRISPDGSRVAYVASQETEGLFELFVAPIDGSAGSLRLSAPAYAPGVEADVAFTPDGTRVVYRSNQTNGFDEELFSVPVDGSLAAIRLNGPHGATQDVRAFQLSSDGSRVVYLSDELTNDLYQLFSVPVDGSASPIAIASINAVFTDFRTSPVGERVVFRAFQGGANRLYSAPVDGSQAPVELNDPLAASGDVLGFALSPDGASVVYVADEDAFGVVELYVVPIDGTADSLQLSGTLVAGGDVRPSSSLAFRIDPTGQRVVYLADQRVDEVVELFSVPLDGGGGPVALNGTLPAGGDVQTSFEISGDGSHVVYLADQNADEAFELFRARVDGSGTPKRLNRPLPAGGDVLAGFRIGADGRRVVYRADQLMDEVFELYHAPLAANSAAVRVNPPLPAGGDVTHFQLAPDGRSVAYRADQEEDNSFLLYHAPLVRTARRMSPSGSASTAIELTGPLVPGGDVEPDFSFGPGGLRVVYRAPQDAPAWELYSARAGRSASSVKLNGPLPTAPGGRVEECAFAGSGARAVYRGSQDSVGVSELYSTPADGSGSVTKLSGSMPLNGDVASFQVHADGSSVVYLADQDTNDVLELYAVPADGSAAAVKLSAALVPGGDVQLGARLAGSRAVYLADQDVDEVRELYSVPIDGSESPAKLHTSLASNRDVDAFAISSDGSRVVYRADASLNDRLEIFSVPADAGTAPVQLNGAFGSDRDVWTFGISPAGDRVAYVADQDANDVFELYTVPIDGSAAAVRVSGAMVAGGGVSDQGDAFVRTPFQISPDGSRIVYRADQDTDELFELYGAPIDGTGAAVKLHPPLSGSDFATTEISISPDSSRVVFTIVGDGSPLSADLISVPVDGSASPVTLASTLCVFERNFSISPDSGRVVYVAESSAPGVYQLFSVPIDGSQPPVLLNDPLPVGALGTGGFELYADGSRVAYVLDQDAPLVRELFSVPIDGSQPPVKLNGALVTNGDVSGFVLGPQRVLYLADQDTLDAIELYSSVLP